jgi:hypothetical protein
LLGSTNSRKASRMARLAGSFCLRWPTFKSSRNTWSSRLVIFLDASNKPRWMALTLWWLRPCAPWGWHQGQKSYRRAHNNNGSLYSEVPWPPCISKKENARNRRRKVVGRCRNEIMWQEKTRRIKLVRGGRAVRRKENIVYINDGRVTVVVSI